MIIDDIVGTKITFSVEGRTVTVDLVEIFSIDDTNLVKEYSRQASLYAYFAVLSATSEHESAISIMDMEQEYAIQDQEWRESVESEGKKVTESMIKQLILSDKDYRKHQTRAMTYKHYHRILKAVCSALEQRASMLVSMGAYLRHEADMGNINIKERMYDKTVDDVKSVIKNRRKSAEDTD